MIKMNTLSLLKRQQKKGKSMIKIKNARVYNNGCFENKDLFINHGKITFSAEGECESIDANGKMLIPGFIDIHIHGAMGYDFNDGSEKAVDEISRFTASHGTTSLLATTSTVNKDTAKKAIDVISKKLNGNTPGAYIVGVHMEGPFFNPSALGAQNPQFVQLPSMENLEYMLGENAHSLKLLALAPEQEGALELIKQLSARGVRTAIGHTAADYATALEAIGCGCNMMTHFYNAMTPLKHREPGVVGAAFDSKNVEIQLICDFIHVHPAALRIAIQNVGVDNVIMISDAISGTGLGDGKYDLGGLDIFVKDGIARIAEGNLAGSTLTLDTAMKNMVKIGYPIETVIKFLSENPARAIGVADRKGYIKEGYDADFILIDDDFSVAMTFVLGKPVYKNPSE